MRILIRILIALVLVVVFVAVEIFVVPAASVPTTQPLLGYSYTQAVAEINQDIAKVDLQRIQSVCRPILLDHGTQTKKAILLFHGYTSCPQQFEPFAKLLYDQGYNVYVPLLPEHGLTASHVNELHQLTAEELTASADLATARALGLGNSLTVLGISMGGVLSLWEAQHDSRIAHVVAIAPAIYLNGIPTPLRSAVARIFSIVPAYFLWWDGVLKDKAVSAPYVLKQNSSKADGEIIRVNLTFEKNLSNGVLARPVVIFANQNDETVPLGDLQQLFPKILNVQPSSSFIIFPQHDLPHDVIDIHKNPYTDEVYTMLLKTLDAWNE